ncbi:GDSL esterase/lipase At5g03610-like isoform X2 [Ziziphus jujuba]|uniref:GDSL esterase/lipase At5g03610-like isoform X2 n=1 Tax=Ziziphus jujuba TaxID=326968 RepID=A0ABM4AGY1_ZIZJJ|nr:GDSL esterase/lipase At5g03610-like isoform X2 [Ziziphus jujuba]
MPFWTFCAPNLIHNSPGSLFFFQICLYCSVLLTMDKQTIIFISFCCFLFAEGGARRTKLEGHSGSVKLFVFGDSYADTGNSNKSYAVSWKQPYGITFPRKPAGRFSDGRVLTDYLAWSLGIRSLVPYTRRGDVEKWEVQNGMNFAYGGTGVFNTLEKAPNMSTQISFFQQLLQQKWYTKQDLNSSIALLSLAGNDYGTFVVNHGNNPKDMSDFSKLVVNQLADNIKQILSLGVRKIAVTTIHPLGCLPQITIYSSWNSCNHDWNLLSNFHNQQLWQRMQSLNNTLQTDQKKNVIVVLDLYTAFQSAFAKQKNITGNPLKPCCVGISNGYGCGSVDQSGAKKYSVCKNRELSFFWDMIHPSQKGWHAVYSELQPSLYKLF